MAYVNDEDYDDDWLMPIYPASGTRTCSYCKRKIKKGDNFLDAGYRGHSESHTKNICLLCLKKAMSMITRKEIKMIENRRLIEDL